MLNRSEESYQAAMLLMHTRHYTSSVVALYYSVLQRMMYALANDVICPISYEAQDPFEESIHERILAEIKNRIRNSKEANNFKELFKELYDYRKKADYQADIISQDEFAECRSIYEGLMSRLNRFFPLS